MTPRLNNGRSKIVVVNIYTLPLKAVLILILYFESFALIDSNIFNLQVDIRFQYECGQLIFNFVLHDFNTKANFPLMHIYDTLMLKYK